MPSSGNNFWLSRICEQRFLRMVPESSLFLFKVLKSENLAFGCHHLLIIINIFLEMRVKEHVIFIYYVLLTLKKMT